MATSDVAKLESELQCSVDYLSNVNSELGKIFNVVDSVCIDYICAKRALNGSDAQNEVLYKRLERWRHQVGLISEVLALHRENNFLKSDVAEQQFMDGLGEKCETISIQSELYQNVLKFKKGILAIKFASSFARQSNNLWELIRDILDKNGSNSRKHKNCLIALSEISKIFKYVISDSALTTSTKKTGESVYANNILRQFLKISVDATDSYNRTLTNPGEIALNEFIKYMLAPEFTWKGKYDADTMKFEAKESPITFYLFNLQQNKDSASELTAILKKKGFANLLDNFIHPYDVHSYYFDIKATSELLASIHKIQEYLIQNTILGHSVKIINAIKAVISDKYYPTRDVHLNDAIYRAFVAATFMIKWKENMLSNVWNGEPFLTE